MRRYKTLLIVVFLGVLAFPPSLRALDLGLTPSHVYSLWTHINHNLIGMTGIEALERLKVSPATTNIPVIALTARASAKDKALGLEAGFVDYLTKPIDVEMVTFAIHQACRSA